ncbi:MAG: hypothetical protein JSS76_00995 [Bacteroidetes bacterium]|nr:hypothetical protein [Bacteroidota bacterium]
MKSQIKSHPQNEQEDFVKSYNEMMTLVTNVHIEKTNYDWEKTGDRIKIFSLYKNNVTPTLSSHSSIIQ